MNCLQLQREIRKLKEENEKLKIQIKILYEIIETEDKCINELFASNLETAKSLAAKQGIW